MAEELPSKSAENFWHKERRLWIRRDLVRVNYDVDNKYTFVIHSSRFVPVLMEDADLDTGFIHYSNRTSSCCYDLDYACCLRKVWAVGGLVGGGRSRLLLGIV